MRRRVQATEVGQGHDFPGGPARGVATEPDVQQVHDLADDMQIRDSVALR